jgi:orotate phosphoribosyltransferase
MRQKIKMAVSNAENIENAIMASGVWHLADYVFASGKTANNKFEIPLLLEDEEASQLVLRELGGLAMAYEPDVLWGVPSGGEEFACYLGEELGLPVARLNKVSTSPGRKTFEYKTRYDERLAHRARRMVGLEDITTELTSVAGALELQNLKAKTTGVVAVWRRGTPEVEKDLGVEVSWLVKEAVPNMITPDHPFYKKYQHLATTHEE